MTQELIKMLHSEVSLAPITDKNKYITQLQRKAKLLQKCGFANHPDIKLANITCSDKPTLINGHVNISKNITRYLCDKYNLIQEKLEKFVGHIPMKNLEEISAFIDKHQISGKNLNNFSILAPKEMFSNPNTQDDPIVLYGETKTTGTCWENIYTVTTYTVVSKWGLESNDNLILNPNQN